jgi:hypothetical protein
MTTELKLVTEQETQTQKAKDNIANAEAEISLTNGCKKLRYMGKDCFVRHPSPREVADLQKDYAIGFAKLLKDGALMTKREMLQTLEKRGLWTKQDSEELEEKRIMYSDTYKAWYSFDYESRADNPEFAQLQLDYLRSMKEYMMLANQLDELMANTIEKILESEQAIKKTYYCVYSDNEGKERFFKNILEVENPINSEQMSNFIGDCLAFWMGIGERFLEQLPEIISGKKDTKQ